MRRHTPVIVLTVLAALGATASVRADLITFSVTRSTPFFPDQPFDVPGFDPTLGTLEAAALRMDVAANNQIMTVINGPPFFPPQGPVELSITRLLFGPAPSPALLTVVQTDLDTVTGLPGPPFGGSVQHTFSLPAASAGPVTLTSPSDLGFFTQAGAVTLRTGGFFQARGLFPDVGPVGSPSPGTANVTVTVDYTFTPVPEPTTLTLLGIGAGCLVGWGWRRQGRDGLLVGRGPAQGAGAAHA